MMATVLAWLTAVSIVPAELCEGVFHILLCTGNLLPKDLEESRENPIRRTLIYEFPDIGGQANGSKRRQAANT